MGDRKTEITPKQYGRKEGTRGGGGGGLGSFIQFSVPPLAAADVGWRHWDVIERQEEVPASSPISGE